MKLIACLYLLIPLMAAPARQYIVSTAAGNGGNFAPDVTVAPAGSFALGSPLAVGIDQANRLLVASGPRLLRLEAGNLVSIAGGPSFGTTGDGGDPRQASLSN
ncbi:MAG: hypothetical protein IAF94_01360, partial [Pirellulaceae bacterium]|nr:hypothetical protein [Pirellulaceae bacterium]